MDLGGSLEFTATWAVAFVCSALILISLLMEQALHFLSHLGLTIMSLSIQSVNKKKRKTLNQAVLQLKSELRSLGFMSLLLTMAKQPITKICISKSLGDTFLPCKNAHDVHTEAEELDYCGKGKVPLMSSEGISQLQMLIFVLAIFHVITCLVTLTLANAKINRWQSWEEETRTLEHQLSNDPRRFRFTRQTSFGQRHLTFWSNRQIINWPICFLRQFTNSVAKVDYFALRNGFIKSHLSQHSTFDFHKFLQRSIDRDFLMIMRISPGIWLYNVLVIFFNAHDIYNHYWLPFIPLVILVVIGTKLESIITELCLKSSKQVLTPGLVSVDLDDNLFWFRRPKLILCGIHFVLIQNSFQLTFFTWTWYKFGFQSCFHRETVDVVLTVTASIIIQLLCAYCTLPRYALVTRMGSSMNEAIFTDNVVKGLQRWHKRIKKNILKSKSFPSEELSQSFKKKVNVATRSIMKPLPHPRNNDSSSNSMQILPSKFEYPSNRLELMEIEKVVEKMIECSSNNTIFEGEISFRQYVEEAKKRSSKQQ